MDVQTEKTLHNRASETIKRLRDLDRNLSRVTASICGHSPEVAEQSAKAIEENVHDKFDTISRIIASMEDEMNRLSNTVGSNQSLGQQFQGGIAKAAAY